MRPYCAWIAPSGGVKLNSPGAAASSSDSVVTSAVASKPPSLLLTVWLLAVSRMTVRGVGGPSGLGVMWGDQVARPTQMWKLDSGAAFAAYPHYPVMMWIDVTAERSIWPASASRSITLWMRSGMASAY